MPHVYGYPFSLWIEIIQDNEGSLWYSTRLCYHDLLYVILVLLLIYYGNENLYSNLVLLFIYHENDEFKFYSHIFLLQIFGLVFIIS